MTSDEKERDAYMAERTTDLEPLDPTEADKDKKAKRKRTVKDEEEDLRSAYASALSTWSGRLMLHDILDKLGYSLIPFDPTSPHMTSYLNGKHAAAIELFNVLWTISKDDVLTMMKENRT